MSLDKEIQRLKKQIKNYNLQEKRLIQLFRYGEVSRDFILDELNQVKRDRETDVLQIENLVSARERVKTLEKAEITLAEYCQKLKNHLDCASYQDKRDILDMLAIKVTATQDAVRLARKIGFHMVMVYTNGTLPIEVSADSVFVSLDGLRETHNRLRGDSFDRVMQNIKDAKHPNMIVNFTINSVNQSEIEEFCHEMKRIEQIRGVFFYFHTPYYGYDELFLNLEEKRSIIRRILALKRKGYGIFNSVACLKGVYEDNWGRPSKLCYVYAENKLYQCCRAIGNSDTCRDCGYLAYPEIMYILKLRPTAIISALNYLPRR